MSLYNRATRELLLAAETDKGGRVSLEVEDHRVDPSGSYELVFSVGGYWSARSIQRAGSQIMYEIVLRIAMPNPAGRYHVPVIVSPNTYSVWWST